MSVATSGESLEIGYHLLNYKGVGYKNPRFQDGPTADNYTVLLNKV